ncbi:50S ribosomal protein L9 [Chloroflexota bacterium]
MKVVFIEDLNGIAEIGDMKSVADGYGRNFLIPKGYAVLAGSSSSNTIKERMKVKAKRMAEFEKQMTELARRMKGVEINIKARVGANGKLYGSVTASDIAQELEQLGYVVDKRKIEIEESIRQLGEYNLTVKLGKDITTGIKLIVSEDAEAAAAADNEEKASHSEAVGEAVSEPEAAPETEAVVESHVAFEAEKVAEAEAATDEESAAKIEAELTTEDSRAAEDETEQTSA